MNERVALVTGGGRGIGREAALLLSAAGARVMVVSRSAAELAASDSSMSRPISAQPRVARWPLPKPSDDWDRLTC